MTEATTTNEADVKAKLEQKVTITDVGPARKAITIEIPAERIAEKLKTNMGQLQNDAAIPGFRKGRAPLRLIEKRFGSSVRDEAKGQLIAESYQQVLTEEKLEVLGEPEVKDMATLTLPESGVLTVTVEVEVVPNFELPALESVEVKKPALAVTDKQVEDEIKALQQRFGKLIPAGEKLEHGDLAWADVKFVEGKDAPVDGPEIAHQPGAYVMVPTKEQEGKGHIAGVAIEDLDKKLVGKKVGDKVAISLTGPANHEEEKIKDKPITIHVTINRADRVEPATLEALAQQLGLGGAEEVNKKIKEMLDARREREQRQAMHQQICDHLLETVKMDLPKNISRRQTARILHRQAMEMAMRGMPEHELERKLAELRAGTEAHAHRQLKLFFILDRLAHSLDVEVTENEVNGAIAMMAMQQGRRPEKLRQQMMRNGQIEQVYLEARDTKTLDKVLEKAKIVEVDKLEEKKEKPEAKEKAEPKKKSESKAKAEAKDEAAEESAKEAKPKSKSKSKAKKDE